MSGLLRMTNGNKDQNLRHDERSSQMTRPVKSRRRCCDVEQFDFAPYPVQTPKWMQRQMLKNLRKSSVSRINLTCAAKSREILAELKAASEAASPNAENIPVMTEKSINHQPERQQPQPCKQNIRHRIGRLLRKPVQRIAGFFRRSMPTPRVHSR